MLPANRPEQDAAPSLAADIEAQGLTIGSLYIDRGYINAPIVDEILARRGTIICRPWLAQNGDHYGKRAFKINMRDRTITCPAGARQPIVLGSKVEFPAETCGVCPLRAKCTDAAPDRGRSVAIADNELLQHRLRKQAAPPQVDKSSASACLSNIAKHTRAGGKVDTPVTSAAARTSSICDAPPPSAISKSFSGGRKHQPPPTRLWPGLLDRDGFNPVGALAVECHTNASGKPIPEATRSMYREKGGHLNRLLRTCGGCAVNGDLAEAERCERLHASIQLTLLKRHDVVRYIDNRTSEGAKRTTIRKELNTLSVALKQAANRGWVSHAAAHECIPPYAAESQPRTRWLTHEEFPKLLAALDTTAWMVKRLRKLPADEAERLLREHAEHVADRQLFVTVACFTGAELSALTLLDWTDINFKAATIRIPGTKNATRDRTIDLDPQLAAALAKVPPHRRVGRVLRLWANACTDLRAACKRAGIERVTPHTFRHTFGSWLVQAGVPTFTVGQLMGHRDSKMVERYYGKLAPKNRSEAIAKLPRFPSLFTTDAQLADGACATSVPSQVAQAGAHDAAGASVIAAPSVGNSPAANGKPRDLSGEGGRTRTFNQRIKSPMLYH